MHPTRRGTLALLAALPVMAAGGKDNTMLIKTRSGADIEMLAEGKGPRVVLVASLGRSIRDFDDLAGRLVKAGYRVLRPEPRGIGRSIGAMTGVTLKELAEDVLDAAAHDGPGPLILAGHAFGNRVVRMAATLAPERVAGLILLAAGGSTQLAPEVGKALGDVFDTSLSAEAHLAAVKTAFFAPGKDPAAWKAGWYGPTAQMQMAATRATAVDSWWQGGSAPILVLQPMDDVVAPPENARRLKEQGGERVQVVEIKEAGHALLPEQPDKVADAVLAFLRQVAR